MKHLDLGLIIGNVGWKDTNLRYLGCNANLSATHNMLSADEIIGLTDSDLPGLTRKNCELYYETDRLALAGNTINKLHVNNQSLHLITKKPFFDSDNKIAGIIYHCQLVDDVNLCQQLQPIVTVVPLNSVRLSAREQQCLQHLVKGKTAKWIADKLGLSKRTIESYIDNIKSKMGCVNKAELLVAAIKHGYQAL
jgi:DNA-binding CsgD family transcriptional regulator